MISDYPDFQLKITHANLSGPPRQPRMPRIGPCQVSAATLTLSQPGGQIMPTLYWGPWLAKIRRGGPANNRVI